MLITNKINFILVSNKHRLKNTNAPPLDKKMIIYSYPIHNKILIFNQQITKL